MPKKNKTQASPAAPTSAKNGHSELSSDRAERKPADEIDNTVPTRGDSMLPMVGLGGSAGSIAALQEFFAAMPVDTGMAFVVILHLSPEHESMLAEMFQRSTAMPVVTAKDKAKVEANCVYVIPPGKHLSSVNGHLALTEAHEPRGKRVAVDVFFRSLAETHGPQSVAVVLSGVAGDGALGLKRIKECGGLTIAQDPDEAEHSGMPRSAIATGMVDWVLEVKEMPARLVKYMGRHGALKLPAEEGPHPAHAADPAADADEAALRDVLAFLHTRTARDFSYYKRATILRRIARRMQVNGLDDLPGYLGFLRTHAGEAGALLQDLLISVTNFFRDPDSFTALERIVPDLFRDKGPGDSVRVWVAGCATGEEAYSIAMLLCEHARTLEAPPQIQIFATDLNEDVIREARDGIYPETIATDVSEERLRRYFIQEHGNYRVRREVREIVLFAPHDLLKDSPFSRLDLISCRNLLIYLNRDAQQRAFDIFHYALRPGGRLFLGTSETVDDGSSLFAVIDKKQRLYLQRPGPRQILAVPAGPSTLARARELQERWRERPTVPSRVTVEGVRSGPDEPLPFDTGLTPGELHYRLIERFSPPSILVNAAHDIVHLSESAGRFLQIAGGEPTRNLLRAVHPMLRIELRAALYAAKQTHTAATAFHVPVETGEERSAVDIRVTPAGDLAPDILLVVFEAHPADGPAAVAVPRTAEADQVAQHLERELDATKAHLRETIEESEASTEELKASNEELQAMNEELRSATEELETSREELQSINEEVTTVNDELKSKVDQLARSNSDLQNLMAATDIAIIFLDRDLRIMRFTPSAQTLFNFIPTDLGRPLSDLTRQLDYPEIVADAGRALAHLQPAEREVRAGDHCYLARTLPYRTEDDHIAGVVLTFLDITTRKAAEEEFRRSEGLYRAIGESIEYGVWVCAPDGRNTYASPSFLKLVGLTQEQCSNFGWGEVLHPEDAAGTIAAWQECVSTGKMWNREHRFRGVDGRWHAILARGVPVKDEGGQIVCWAGINLDITDRKAAEEALRASEARFRAAVSAVSSLIWTNNADGMMEGEQPGWENFTGQSQAEYQGHGWSQAVHPDDAQPTVEAWERAVAEKRLFEFEHRLRRRDGEWRLCSIRAMPVVGADGAIREWVGVHTDITERRRDEEALRQAHHRLETVMGSITDGLAVLDKSWRYTYFSEQAARIIGMNAADLLGGCVWDLFPAAEGTKFHEGYHRAVATGQKVEFEEYYPEPINKWLECHCYPSAEGLSVYFHDVTGRKQAEEVMRASNQRTLLATEATGVGIWGWNVLTGEIRWDVQMFRLYGITPTADGYLQYSTWSQTVFPEDLPGQEAILEETVRRAGHSTRAFRIRRESDGKCRHIESVETARTNAQGETEWVIGTNLDVTERKEAENARLQNEFLFSTLIEQAPMGVYVVDADFLLQQVNSLAQPVFRMVRPLIGRDFTEVMETCWGQEVGGDVARLFRRTLETGERYISPPFVHARADLGVEQAYDWEAQRVTLPDGRHGVVCYFIDVTEKRRAEAALLEAKEAAETANQSKDRFLAVLSHELRTPLTPVLMVVGALEHDPDLRADVREDLAMIKRNVELETKLIDDLLDLSRITSGKVELKSESIDLNALVSQVCAICRPQLADAKVGLETHLDANAGIIAADPARLQQVLWNVLKNAVKFTPAEGRVRVSTGRIGPDRCEVRVTDTGIGIPPEVLPRIFNAFEQGDANVTRQFGGLGLGLAISRALVELHGGTIRAESAGQGCGATFIVELPGSAAVLGDAARVADSTDRNSAVQLRLLLVEDHADTARTLARLLRREGFAVVAAADVASAIAAAEREPFDILVSDLGLPDGDGYEIMRAVRARRIVPGIAMSGYGMEEDIRRSTEAGFTEHLVKPVAVPQLIAAIRRVTETRG